MEVPETRFADSPRGGRIAFQDFGTDGPVVIAVPPTAQNIDLAWDWPEIRGMFRRFGAFARWIHFDKRGAGASDRRSRAPGLDERVDDLAAVMDAAGVERAFLYGASEGGPTCVAFAASYPERVSGLVLHGTGPYTSPQDLTAEQRAHASIRHQHQADLWGTSASQVAAVGAPSLADDPTFLDWHRAYERQAADRASMKELLDLSLDVDVREMLPLIEAPTLVLHRSGDPVIPVDWGRELAAGIRYAELIETDGTDHFDYAGERAWLTHLERFVTGSAERPLGDGPTDVVIRTLGGFAVDVRGEPIDPTAWGSRTARLLCKRLAAARGWPVLREELMELLWPSSDPGEALGPRLSVQLSHVRRVLGGGVLADRDTVALDLSVVSTDLEQVLGSKDAAEIVALYRGEFLPADGSEDWTAPCRERARSVFIDAARRLADAALQQGDLEQAAVLAERILASDPHDDVAQQIARRVTHPNNTHPNAVHPNTARSVTGKAQN